MSYDRDEFVNVTAPAAGQHIVFEQRTGMTAEDLYERRPEEFERLFTFDTRNESATPVWIYEWMGEPVAWYDCERLQGYIVE